MAFTGIQATVDFYSMQEVDLTNDLTDIMMSITRAGRNNVELSREVGDKKEAVKASYEQGSDEYKEAMSEIQDDYELKLHEITEWENELETKKNEIENEIKATSSYKESFTSALKQNVQNDFKYGQN